MTRSDWYLERWLRAVDDTPWTVRWQGGQFLDLEHGRHHLRVCRSDLSLDSNVTFRIAGDKKLSAQLLVDAGVPTPDFTSCDAMHPFDIIRAVDELGDRAVIKPVAGTGSGYGITVGPTGRRLILRAIREAAVFGRGIAVQDRIDGRVIRALVLRGELLDAVHRAAASVVGDGVSTVDDLVDEENRRRRALGPLTTGQIIRSADFQATLRQAGLSRRSVPEAGATVTVSGLSNTGSERDSVRIGLSPAATKMAIDAAEALGVNLAGVDLVIDDDGNPLSVLEVNTGPGLHWHVVVAENPYDPFVEILNRVGGP